MQGKDKAVMATKLESIAAKAQSNAILQFTSLAHHVTADLVRECLQAIPRSTGKGVDQVDVDTARSTFDEWCPGMLEAMHRRGYSAPPVRRVYIPKPGKSERRPIGVPTVADRALQKAVATILTPIYEADFLPCSFGGRPGRSAHRALATFRQAVYARKVSWVLEADLKNFFGSLDHGWALRFAEQRVGDPRVLSLLRRWLKAGVMEEGKVEDSDRGTPQGGPISVLISNLYLHYVLDLWIEKVVSPRMQGEIYYIRYLDDFVICFQYKGDADKVSSVLPRRLAKFGLELEPSKTCLVEFGRYARANSQKYNRDMATISFLGFTLYCGESKNGHFVVRLKTEGKRLKRSIGAMKDRLRSIRHQPLRDQSEAINSFLNGHYCYYGVGSNAMSLRRLYLFTYQYWRRALSTRSQSGYVNWKRYEKILSFHPILKPKIYLPLEAMSQMASL